MPSFPSTWLFRDNEHADAILLSSPMDPKGPSEHLAYVIFWTKFSKESVFHSHFCLPHIFVNFVIDLYNFFDLTVENWKVCVKSINGCVNNIAFSNHCQKMQNEFVHLINESCNFFVPTIIIVYENVLMSIYVIWEEKLSHTISVLTKIITIYGVLNFNLKSRQID